MPINHLPNSEQGKQFISITDYEKDENDNVYFSVEIRSSDQVLGENAIYSAQRTIPIIQEPSNYYASVIRFNIPNFYVPIHVMPIQSNQSDPNLSEYSVTLEYDGDVQQVFLDYDSRNDFQPPIPPSQTSNGLQAISSYYFMYDYQHMADLINFALEIAFGQLASLPPTVGGNQPSAPELVFLETQNQIFSFLCQSDYYDKDLAKPIILYVNAKLWTILNGFPNEQVNVSVGGSGSINQFSPDGRDIKILIDDYYKNTNLDIFQPSFGGDYYNISQQYTSVFNWNSFKRIVLTTSSIPIQSESIKGSGSGTLKVLTDFSPFVSNEVRTIWQYIPEGQYRLIDMKSHTPLTEIDMRLFWTDRFDNFYPIIIPWGQQATIKLGFFNKKLYKNYVATELKNHKRDRLY
jgi:hypothetical protein